MTVPASKTCVSCGRTITWRKKWARDWESVRYCSQACRRAKLSDSDRQLELSIQRLLDQRGGSAGVRPEAAADDVAGGDGQHLRERARAAARRLSAAGTVQIVQDGRVVDPSRARGPFLIRRPE
jgi:hypothetical protein